MNVCEKTQPEGKPHICIHFSDKIKASSAIGEGQGEGADGDERRHGKIRDERALAKRQHFACGFARARSISS
jgi:hypothetical protein